MGRDLSRPASLERRLGSLLRGTDESQRWDFLNLKDGEPRSAAKIPVKSNRVPAASLSADLANHVVRKSGFAAAIVFQALADGGLLLEPEESHREQFF